MGLEGLKFIYPHDSVPVVPDAIDSYLTDIESTDVHNTPSEAIKYPGTITERLKRVQEAARHIELDRHLIAYHGSVLREVYERSPETIEGLSDDQREQVMELISRMRPKED